MNTSFINIRVFTFHHPIRGEYRSQEILYVNVKVWKYITIFCFKICVIYITPNEWLAAIRKYHLSILSCKYFKGKRFSFVEILIFNWVTLEFWLANKFLIAAKRHVSELNISSWDNKICMKFEKHKLAGGTRASGSHWSWYLNAVPVKVCLHLTFLARVRYYLL